MYTCDLGTLLTFPFVCFDCKISIRLRNRCTLLLWRRGFGGYFTISSEVMDLAGVRVFLHICRTSGGTH